MTDDKAKEKNRVAQARWRETHKEERRIAAAMYHAKRQAERAIRRECGR